MKKFIITFLLFLFVHNSHAGYRIYSGGNLSKFNTSDSFLRFGEVFGIDKTWDNDEYSWALGLQYIVRSAYIKGKTMIFYMSDQGYHFDALFSVGYLEIPFMHILNLNAYKKINFGISLGPSLAIALFDNSKSYKSRHFSFEDDPDYRYRIKDYYRESEDPGPLWLQTNAGFYLNAGFLAEYQNIYLELRYCHGVNKLGILKGLNMNGEKFRTIEIYLGIYIHSKN